jgi:hypothetical protein
VDWKTTGFPLLGLVLTSLSRFVVAALVRRVKSGIPLPAPKTEMAESWKTLTTEPEKDKSGELLGDLERTLFFFAFWLSSWEVVAAWFALKVASKWEAWSTTGALPESLPNVDPFMYLFARRRWASQRLMSFLVGTLANVLFAFVSVLLAKHLRYLCV